MRSDPSALPHRGRRSVLRGFAAVGALLGGPRLAPSGGPTGSGVAHAAGPDPIGFVKTARGDVRIVVDGRSVPAAPGTPVTVGCTVVTGDDGSVGITLRDDSLIALGAGSRLTLDAFRFAPARGELGLVATLLRGTLEFVSGAIARLRPEAVRVRTPTSTIGVRGTRFVVRVDE